jgi:hypothetical protein
MMEIAVPPFLICSHPTIKITDILSNRYDVLGEMSASSANDICKEEEINALNCIEGASDMDEFTKEIDGDLDIKKLDEIFTSLRFVPANITMSAKKYDQFRSRASKKEYDCDFPYLVDDENSRCLNAGRFRSARILVTPSARDKVYITAAPALCGYLIAPYDPIVMASDETKNLRVGFICYLEIGMFSPGGGCAVVRHKEDPARGSLDEEFKILNNERKALLDAGVLSMNEVNNRVAGKKSKKR